MFFNSPEKFHKSKIRQCCVEPTMCFQHFSFMSISNFMLKLFMKKVAETVISLNTCMHFAFSSSGERITLSVLLRWGKTCGSDGPESFD